MGLFTGRFFSSSIWLHTVLLIHPCIKQLHYLWMKNNTLCVLSVVNGKFFKSSLFKCFCNIDWEFDVKASKILKEHDTWLLRGCVEINRHVVFLSGMFLLASCCYCIHDAGKLTIHCYIVCHWNVFQCLGTSEKSSSYRCAI